MNTDWPKKTNVTKSPGTQHALNVTKSPGTQQALNVTKSPGTQQALNVTNFTPNTTLTTIHYSKRHTIENKRTNVTPTQHSLRFIKSTHY